MSDLSADGKPIDLKELGRQFSLPGRFVSAAPYGSGHINDTFAAVYDQGGTPRRYLHQRINHKIFKDPPRLMENVSRVTSHQAAKLLEQGTADAERRALTVLPAMGGRPYHLDREGRYWRTYIFIENARTYDVIESTAQAEQAARAFGEFQRTLADLPGARLHETIPGFHDSPWRFKNMEEAIQADVKNRAQSCAGEIEDALGHRQDVGRLLALQAAGGLPERVTHNDTKLNNVMLDDATGGGLCVIDLDTVMPGLALYDFGDMVRTATMPVKEDEQDLSKVVMQRPMFEALVRGYLSSADFLVPAERANLAFGGWLITFEIGIRFLADHLNGDVYFKIHRPDHNLDRARTQLTLARDIWRQLDDMQRLADRA